MTDEMHKRIGRIILNLYIYWMKHPNWRFGQMLENVFGCVKREKKCIFYIEDDEVEKRLMELRKHGKK